MTSPNAYNNVSPVLLNEVAGYPSASNSAFVCNPTVQAAGGISTCNITVRDQFNNPISNASVLLSSTGSGNNFSTNPALTDANGNTTITLESGTAETKIVTATINGSVILPTQSITFYVSTPTQAHIVATPSTQEASLSGVSINLTISITDQHGNPANDGIVVNVSGIPSTSGTVTVIGSGNTASGQVTRTLNFNNKGDVALIVNISSIGNLALTGDSIVHFVDTTMPVITPHGGEIAEATSYTGAVVNYTNPTAIDNIDGTVPVTCIPVSGSTFALGDTTITCTASDSVPNTQTSTFVVRIIDTTKPNITAPADITTEATAHLTVVDLGTSTVSDIADPTPTVTNDAPAAFPVGTTIVTWTATDDSSNSQSATQTVTITDNTAPVIVAPADQTFEATEPITEPVPPALLLATATDIVDPAPVITYTPHTFDVGIHTVTWTATDTSGNSSSVTSIVTITDTIAPIINSHSDITAEATGPTGTVVTYTDPTATDLVDGTVAVICGPASGSTFSIGDTIVTCNATDSHGNAAVPVTFNVKVQDTTAPTISEHGDETAEATSPAGAVVFYTDPTATDLVDGTVAVICGPASGSTFSIGDTTVNCSAQDSQLVPNIATSHFTVHVIDTTAPDITAPSDITHEANGVLSTVADLGTPIVSDIADPSPIVTNDAPANYSIGTTIVTWTATDDSGNHSSATQNVTIVPAPIAKLTVAAYSPVDTTQTSIVTVNGKDQYNHITTNQSGTVVVLSADSGGALGSTILTLTNGEVNTTLNKSTAGIVHVTVSSGSLIPDTTAVTFTPADTEGPIVISVNPSGGDVSISAPLFFTTDEPLKSTTVNSANAQLWKAATTTLPAAQVPAVVSLVEGGKRVNIAPSAPLEYSTSYYFVITTDITDEASNALTTPKDSSSTGFTTVANTADLTPPAVVYQYPALGATGVALAAQPSIDFSEAMDATTFTSANIKLIKDSDSSEILATIMAANGATRAIIQPASPLKQNTAYHMVVTTGVKDVAGNYLVAAYTGGSFTTVQVPPSVVDEIVVQNNYVVADNTYINGWHYIFRITVNTNETQLKAKFADWVNSADPTKTVVVNGNTRLLFNSAGGGIGAGVGLTNSDIENGYGTVSSYSLGNEYSDQAPPFVDTTGIDNNLSVPGRQIQFDVFTKIPITTAPGFYTTNYGVQIN